MIQEVFGKAVTRCSKCGHVTIEDVHKLPELCRNRHCRTRKWNDDAVAKVPAERVLEAIAEADQQIKAVTGQFDSSLKAEKPYETFQKSLCTHGMYKPLCKRCQAAA